MEGSKTFKLLDTADNRRLYEGHMREAQLEARHVATPTHPATFQYSFRKRRLLESTSMVHTPVFNSQRPNVKDFPRSKDLPFMECSKSWVYVLCVVYFIICSLLFVYLQKWIQVTCCSFHRTGGMKWFQHQVQSKISIWKEHWRIATFTLMSRSITGLTRYSSKNTRVLCAESIRTKNTATHSWILLPERQPPIIELHFHSTLKLEYISDIFHVTKVTNMNNRVTIK